MSTVMEFGPGTLFISTNKGLTWEPLGETTGGTLEYDPTAYESEEVIETIHTNETATFEAELTSESAKQLRKFILRWRRVMNFRVVHLMLYNRKARTREKNRKRYEKILREAILGGQL